ncbi:MAG: hypothetical protein ACKPAC_24925, partial [Alphaproteobacteria bacterium]
MAHVEGINACGHLATPRAAIVYQSLQSRVDVFMPMQGPPNHPIWLGNTKCPRALVTHHAFLAPIHIAGSQGAAQPFPNREHLGIFAD